MTAGTRRVGASATDPRPRLPASRTSKDGRAATKDDRRTQLLDAAAWLVNARGLAGFTMEGLASAAGVSKALPYRHFDNANAALVALMDREVGDLGRAMLAAADGIDDGDQLIAAAMDAYFDTVEEHGGLLNDLAGPGSPLPDMVPGGHRRPPPFLLDLLARGYRLRGQRATLAAWLVTGLAIAGSDTIARGDAPRAITQPVTVSAIIHTIRTIAQPDDPVRRTDQRLSRRSRSPVK